MKPGLEAFSKTLIVAPKVTCTQRIDSHFKGRLSHMYIIYRINTEYVRKLRAFSISHVAHRRDIPSCLMRLARSQPLLLQLIEDVQSSAPIALLFAPADSLVTTTDLRVPNLVVLEDGHGLHMNS